MSNDTLVDTTSPEYTGGNLDELETSLKESTSEREAGEKKPAEAGGERPAYIPEKFWTGDVQESLDKMANGYKSLESAYGRMANDLGTQRKLTDRLLSLDKEAAPKKEEKALPVVDVKGLVDKPNETLDSYMTAREERLRQEYNQQLQQLQLAHLEQEFAKKHPNYQEIASSPEFSQWVTSSPLRARVAQLASSGDYSAADELLTEFEVQRKAVPPKEEVEQKQRLEAARQASTTSAAQAPSSSPKGKIYRRADLIKMKLERPDQYSDPAYQEEIMRAYAEGRVK